MAHEVLTNPHAIQYNLSQHTYTLSLGAGPPGRQHLSAMPVLCIMLCRQWGESLAKWVPLWHVHWYYMISTNKPTCTTQHEFRVLLCLSTISYPFEENLAQVLYWLLYGAMPHSQDITLINHGIQIVIIYRKVTLCS